MFFDGPVAGAIAASRREGKPLIVLLTAFDQGSRQVQDALIALDREEFAAGSIVIALEDDLSNTDRSQFTDAKNFRAFCPVQQLPAVVMVSPAGARLATITGVVHEAQLRQQLEAAYSSFRRQQAPPAAGAEAAPAAGSSAAPDDRDAVLAAAASAGAAGQRTEGPAAAPAAAAGAAGTAAADPAIVAGEGGGAAGEAATAAESEKGAEEEVGAVAAGVSAAASAAAAAAAGGAEGQEAGGKSGAGAAAEEPPPDPASVPFHLQFKFTDSAVLRADHFTGATTVRELFSWVDEQRAAAAAASSSGGVGRGLAYVLVQTAPRLVLGAAQEGLTLAAAGIQPRTSLQVIPHAALGHKPPVPPQAAPPPLPQWEAQQADQAQQAAQIWQAAGRAAEQQAQQAGQGVVAVKPPPPPPSEMLLQVRLSNGATLRGAFQAGATLAAVLDWIDAERTDRGAYKLCQAFPKRTFFSGDLGKTLLELGFDARTSLQLELLPSGSKARQAAPPAAPSAPAAAPSAGSEAAAAAAAPVLGDFVLQFKLTNGEQLRGSFPPEASLQEVHHYLDTHRTDGGVPYQLVQPFPKRRFTAADLPQQLRALGLQQRQLLLLEPLGTASSTGGGRGGGGVGWSLTGVLAAAAGYLNPYSYLRGGPAGTPREQAAAAAADGVQGAAAGTGGASPSGAGTAAPQQGQAQAAAQDGESASGREGRQQRGPRKRALGGGGGSAPSNIHTLSSMEGEDADGEGNDGRDPRGNSFWNGNSTQFGAGPPDEQQ